MRDIVVFLADYFLPILCNINSDAGTYKEKPQLKMIIL